MSWGWGFDNLHLFLRNWITIIKINFAVIVIKFASIINFNSKLMKHVSVIISTKDFSFCEQWLIVHYITSSVICLSLCLCLCLSFCLSLSHVWCNKWICYFIKRIFLRHYFKWVEEEFNNLEWWNRSLFIQIHNKIIVFCVSRLEPPPFYVLLA